MKHFHYFALALLLISCQEKKKYEEGPIDSVPVPVVPKDYCQNGQLPSVLDTASYKPVVLKQEKDSRTLLYSLGHNDSLVVKISGCAKPSYEYIYSTTRYYRGIDEIKFFYGAVNSFYLMMDKKHQPQAYRHQDLIDASQKYLEVNKDAALQARIFFASEGRNWTYTLEELKDNGENRRSMRWLVVSN